MQRHEPANTESFIEWNERMVRKYDPEAYHLRSHPLIRWIERQRVRVIIRLLRSDSSRRVIEVGCGAANVLEQVPGNYRVGVDISARMVARAKDRLSPIGGKIARAQAEHLPFPDSSFDRVVCSEVLEHLPNPSFALDEMIRILAPNGKMVISLPNEPFIERLKRLARVIRLNKQFRTSAYQPPDHMTDEWHLHIFDREKALQLVTPRARVIKVIGTPSSLLPIHYVLAISPKY